MTITGSPQVRWVLAFWMLVACALLIRLWGTWYGLPFTYYNDEYHEVMRALQLGTGSFNIDRTAKGGLYFILFLEYGLYFVILKLTGVVGTAQEFGKMFVSDPSAFYIMGRVTVAVCGAITVAAVFYLGRRAYSTTAGLLAALFLAINVLHIELSRLIGLDVPLTMLAAIALYYGIRIIDAGRRVDYLMAALFSALATTTKLPGILLILPLLVAHTYTVRGSGGGIREWFGSRELWLAAALFAGILIASDPGIFTVGNYWTLFADPASDATGDDALATVAQFAGKEPPNLPVYYLVAIQGSMGWPLFLLALAAFAYASWKRTPADVLLISYALINYGVISATTSEFLYYPRYALPIIMTLVVLAGRGFSDVLRIVHSRRRLVATVVVAGCAAMPIAHSIANARALVQTDSRTLAYQWFESHVPAGTRVLIEGGKIGPIRSTVPLRDTAEALRRRIEYWKMVEPKQAQLLKYRLAAHQGGGYDLELIRIGSLESLDDYLALDVEYFVVRPAIFLGSRKAGTAGASLLDELRSDPRIALVARFEGVDDTRLSPTVEIYRLRDSGKERKSVAIARSALRARYIKQDV